MPSPPKSWRSAEPSGTRWTEHTDVVREKPERKITNVNVGPDGSTNVQEVDDVVEEPVSSTTVRRETTVEREER